MTICGFANNSQFLFEAQQLEIVVGLKLQVDVKEVFRFTSTEKPGYTDKKRFTFESPHSEVSLVDLAQIALFIRYSETA